MEDLGLAMGSCTPVQRAVPFVGPLVPSRQFVDAAAGVEAVVAFVAAVDPVEFPRLGLSGTTLQRCSWTL